MRRRVNWIVIHHSATGHKHHDDVSAIRAMHIERGFSEVGYHFFIKQDGTIQKGRPEDKEGAHVKGHNKGSLGICLSGNFTKDKGPGEAQLNALEILLIDLCSRYELTKQDILGHGDLAATLCPGFDLTGWLASREWH
jgi:N-acetylmuramoyl-L-alanine amidase